MRRIGLALAIVALSALPGYSQWTPPDVDVPKFAGFFPPVFQNGIPGIRFNKFDGVAWQVVWQPLSENTCRDVANERRRWVWGMRDHPIYNTPNVSNECKQSRLVNDLISSELEQISQWNGYCDWWARDYEAFRQSAARETGSRSSISSERISAQPQPPAAPNIGGAGGSLVQTEAAQAQLQPPAVPSGGAGGSEAPTFEMQPAYDWKLGPESVPSGGAGGSLTATQGAQPQSSAIPGGERTRVASAPATTPAIQQACDPKSFGDAQLQLLLADPNTRARLTSLIAGEGSPQKAKPGQKTKSEQKNRRGTPMRAPTDADRPVPAESVSGISPRAADAIGTMIGVGAGVGLGNVGRRTTSGPAPRGGTSGPALRRGTYDAPPR